ncbi:hypothetical protein N1851_014550 [Merluccius polli]|uniref:Uncharacterized protein n=1 Tax=Merluccius polli TaxID=89951 RepID=A0AA47M145_MERPO|nr:hypothetical protein N1851_033573 [Merluccius polli]KAK0146150.1 hypothetical protein N1851_014550 [Merluccius polli]
MTVTLLRTQVSRGRQITICNDHNHNIYVADAVRHRDVGDKTKGKLTKLFEAGHSPSSALDVLKYDLQVEHGDDYVFATADRALCPTLEYCYSCSHQIFCQEYGSSEGVEMAVALERQIEQYDIECRDQCAKATTSSGKWLLVVICSPFMKRVHNLT